MATELEKILAEGDSSESKAASAELEKAEQQKKIDDEIEKKEEHLSNVNKAIAEANESLKKTRQAKKQSPDEEELPKINFEDPSAKAWDKHIGERVDPMQSELEKEKEEIRTFALQEFLRDKPALAKNPDKVKEVVSTYEKIRTASERTKEGVLLDLDKAYAAVFHEQLIGAARKGRVEQAESDILFSDIAISRGATAYSDSTTSKEEPLSESDKLLLQKWGMTESEYRSDKKKYG